MTAQLDVEALVGLMERVHRADKALADLHERYPYPAADECELAERGFRDASNEALVSGALLKAAATCALPALLAHIDGEDARVAAAVAGAVEANNKAWAKTLDPAPEEHIIDILRRHAAIRETPSA